VKVGGEHLVSDPEKEYGGEKSGKGSEECFAREEEKDEGVDWGQRERLVWLKKNHGKKKKRRGGELS